MYKVMVIDDEDNLRQALEQLLVSNGYAFCGARDAESGLELLASEHPDLLLLDVILPGTNGFDLCARIREQGRRIPVIFLSAKCDIVDKSIGFRAGGDDYVTKPFDSTELLLRIEANIRRHKDTIDFARCRNREGVARIGELEVRFGEYEVRVKGRPVALTTKEFEIVAFLAAHPGKVYSMSLLNAPADASGDEDFDYDAFLGRFSHVLEMRPFDVKRVGNYGFLFLETDPSTSDELDFLMRSDLKEFLR